MIKRVLILFSCVLCHMVVFSQEGLRPLGGRINLLEQKLKAKEPVPGGGPVARTQTTALLQIPFIDDFHYSFRSVYPDPNLWLDSSAYVNSGMAIAPISIGVATFDGLNKHGYPYSPLSSNFQASDAADTLTSRPIDLHVVAATTQTLLPSDSVALSFYYQARGNGEGPEDADSLLLDFYKPNQKQWVNVWSVEGSSNSNTNDTVFNRVLIWVKDTNHLAMGDTAYLTEGFQFRFRNKATTNGDFDHWHIDYVYLDKNRSVFDTVLNDITIETVPTSYLKNYYAMPYRQFVPGEMAAKTSVRLRNNSLLPVNMSYENRTLTYPGHVQLSNYTGGSNIMHSYTQNTVAGNPGGLEVYPNHTNPPITYTFVSPMNTFTEYEIQHYIYRSSSSSTDFNLNNDSVSQYVDFSNYFALDDGSAEAGYYVLGQGGRMAMRVQLNAPDTLQALRIYFDPVGYGYREQGDSVTYRFSLNIWSSNASGPDVPIYTDPKVRFAQYGANDFKTPITYNLTTSIALAPGTYYLGIQQKVATGISIGFDVNEDHHTNFYYDSGSGWTQSGFHGSPMIRAVFGTLLPPVGIKENQASGRSFLIYPNPSSDQFVIASDHFQNTSYQLMNTLGQVVQEENITQSQQLVNTGHLGSGIYFLAIRSDNRLLQQQKIIIQH